MDYILDTETLYESTSSNRNENNISSIGSRLLYSKGKCPVVWNLETKQVEASFYGHKAEVHNQHFVENSANKADKLVIISTSADKSAIIWNYNVSQCKIDILHQFSSPDDNVFLTCQCIEIDDKFYSITTTIDGNIYLWQDSKLVQTLDVKYCCLAAKLYVHRQSQNADLILLMLTGSDNLVHVFQLIPQHVESPALMQHLIDLAGYNDWVKCLDVLALPPPRQNEFLLASACQDSLVRVWHMRLIKPAGNDCDARNMRTIMSKPLTGLIEPLKIAATLETVLSGHTGFVHGLCWVRNQKDASNLELFSCSADKTIVLWQSKINPHEDREQAKALKRYDQCPASQGVWVERCRLGETGETNLPFIGICMGYSDEKELLLAQSLRGAVHSWIFDSGGSVDVASKASGWISSESITGHFDSLTDLSWDKSGTYLLSSSLDATCRLHALSKKDNKWRELARPQVHGHGVNCITSLGFCKFASGAEEKTIRTFEATLFFLKNFEHLAAGDSRDDLDKLLSQPGQRSHQKLPAHAQLPALGLSNRGASSPYDVGQQAGACSAAEAAGSASSNGALPASLDGGWNEISNLVKQLAKIDHLDEPPIEEILLQSTLWWETGKIYGHCNELHALAADSSGKFLASASRANRPDLASILIWETDKYRRVATIEHHSLTVTRLKFSPDDKYLLSVSRDRTWSLSERTGQMRGAYKLVCGSNKSTAVHERIIWDCSWTHDSRYFITVSRDRRAVLWDLSRARSSLGQSSGDRESLAAACATQRQFDCSIQAVDVLPAPARAQSAVSCEYVLALGFENGTLQLNSLSLLSSKAKSAHGQEEVSEWHWNCLRSFENFHQLAIRRLSFRVPNQGDERQSHSDAAEAVIAPLATSGAYELASGGDEGVLKVTRLALRLA